jgi:hypothetical protein
VADTNDNWLSPDDLVPGSLDTDDRSWILLKSPTTRFAGTFYLLIDYRYNGSGPELRAQWTFTKSQPDISSPAINARPPATGDEWNHADAYILRSTAIGAYTATIYALRAHDGSFYIAGCVPVGETHVIVAHYMLNVLRRPKPWDTVKAVTMVTTNLNGVRLRWDSNIVFKSLHVDGSEVSLAPVQFETDGDFPYSYTLTDPWTGQWVTYPVPVFCYTAGAQTFRGELEDIFMVGDQAGEGTIMYAHEVAKAIRIGPFSVPFDQVGGHP